VTTVEIPTRLSVIDDEDEVVEGVQRRLGRKGYKVERVVPANLATVDDVVKQIMTVSEGAFCDHHLRGGHQVDFSGAQIVAELTARNFPSVLFTGVLPEERYSIRRNMPSIPAFLHRSDGLGPAQLLPALAESVAEINSGVRPRRRLARRTPVTIVNSRLTGGVHLVEALVSGWHGLEPIEIPADLLAAPWSTTPADAVGNTFFAGVNLGESDPDLVFFEDFETEPLNTESFEGVT
jgi:hypothetical protein